MLGLAGISAACAAPVPITGAGSYSQSFDTLPNTASATWTDDTTLAAWYAQRSGTGITIIAGTGSSNTGGIYSFGASAATERALGSLASGTPKNLAYGVLFQNTGTETVTINSIGYTGEQWRNGGVATQSKLTFAYLKDAAAITALTPASALPAGWTAVSALDFTGPIATITAGALDGNATANRASISGSGLGISVAAGQYIMLRWFDFQDTGANHGLAIDDLSVSWTVTATPALTLSANPTSFIENAGAAASTGTVGIPAALATDLVIDLLSSDLTEAKVPATATIKAGDTSATFPIDAVNDLLADGTQNVSLSASATGYLAAQTGVTVDNDTDAAITVTVTPPSFSEGAVPGTVTGTVALAEVTPVEVLVTLTSNDTSEATVSSSVTIPANESSVAFVVNAVEDTELDGSVSVRIDATAVGYTAGRAFITVTDDDVATPPTLTPGAIAFVGFNADADDDLAFVALAPIPANETIFFSDNEWNGNAIGDGGAFNTGESVLTWTAPAAGVAAGTVVTLDSLKVSGRKASVGTLIAAGNVDLSGSTETVYAYQGNSAAAPSAFLAVIANHPGDLTTNTGLSANQIIILPTGVDIAAYTGSRSNKTTFTGYLDSLAPPANWITEDGSGDQNANGTPPDVPFDTTAFTLAPPSGYGTWAGLHAGGGTPVEDFDKDGVRNGVEYFMGSPDGFTANPVPVGGKVAWPHSNFAPEATFKVFTSENLSTWTDVTAAATDLDGKVEYILPKTTLTLFVRLEVTVTP